VEHTRSYFDRTDGGASFILDGCLYVAGGNDVSVVRNNVVTDTWSALANMLEGQSYNCAVTIGSTGQPEEQNLFDVLLAKAATRL
jgi:hypothetical protein